MTTLHSDIFEYRPLLFSIAYRMLGEKQEAEDIVQDVYTRWLEMDTHQVQQPRHYLMRAVANCSINRLKVLQQPGERPACPGPFRCQHPCAYYLYLLRTGRECYRQLLFYP